jgi:Pyruvate/2-oxoacid:ferredoxin oxidoreductase delta subunit
VVQQEGAALVDMEDAVPVKNRGQFQRFEIARAVREADLVINLPKLKTHGMMTLTGAVKNLFGCIPGRRKVQWHFNTGVNRDAFARMLVELSALIRPRLTIMDAVVGMEGNGPGSGDPRLVGVVLAGQDPVAIDVVSGTMVGADPSLLYVVRAAAAAGIGETRLDRITILGATLESVMIRGFRLPPQEHLEWRMPEWARGFLKDALTTRPEIDHERCIRCGICQGHCPQGAIGNTAGRFEISYRNCIRCFCCQEFCPQGAITVGRGWVLKLVPSQRHR